MKSILTLITVTLLLISCKDQKTDACKESINKEEIKIGKNLIQGAFDDLWAGVDSTKINDYHTKDFIFLNK
ncbi:hypothetical protein ABW636_21720 [Aquimarina sp. 2201CG1-2-11]|uniref:hypothetical protein n=1 Tax=Aquimarina discodermiae TaxID=3231043 RepID=UPI003461C22C